MIGAGIIAFFVIALWATRRVVVHGMQSGKMPATRGALFLAAVWALLPLVATAASAINGDRSDLGLAVGVLEAVLLFGAMFLALRWLLPRVLPRARP